MKLTESVSQYLLMQLLNEAFVREGIVPNSMPNLGSNNSYTQINEHNFQQQEFPESGTISQQSMVSHDKSSTSDLVQNEMVGMNEIVEKMEQEKGFVKSKQEQNPEDQEKQMRYVSNPTSVSFNSSQNDIKMAQTSNPGITEGVNKYASTLKISSKKISQSNEGKGEKDKPTSIKMKRPHRRKLTNGADPFAVRERMREARLRYEKKLDRSLNEEKTFTTSVNSSQKETEMTDEKISLNKILDGDIDREGLKLANSQENILSEKNPSNNVAEKVSKKSRVMKER